MTEQETNDKKHKTIQVSSSEYAQVMSELNTNLTNEERSHKYIQRAIGDYVYLIEDNGFNNYRIIGRIKLD